MLHFNLFKNEIAGYLGHCKLITFGNYNAIHVNTEFKAL